MSNLTDLSDLLIVKNPNVTWMEQFLFGKVESNTLIQGFHGMRSYTQSESPTRKINFVLVFHLSSPLESMIYNEKN